jgi:hypothetical protein
MADDKILIPVEADTERLEAQIKSSVKGINSQLSKISFASLISGIDAAINLSSRLGSSLANAFSAPVREAAAADEAVEKLNISLKLSGSFSREASNEFLNLSSALQSTTTFSDDAAVGALTLAKNLGLTNDQAVKVTKAAADLAAITGDTLEGATEKLSKSLSGNASQLQRQLPFLRGLTEQQLRAGVAVDILAQKFAGAANALGQTFSGSIGKTSNAFSDLLETVGRFITQNPIVIGLINELGKVFNDLNSFISKNSTTIRAFIDSALIGLIDAFTFIGQAVGTAIRVIAPLASQIATFVAVSIGIKVIPAIISSISTAFTGVSISAGAAQIALNAFKVSATLGLSLIIDQLIKIGAASTSVEDFFRRLAATIKSALSTALDAVLLGFQKVIEIGSKIPGIGSGFAKVQSSIADVRSELNKTTAAASSSSSSLTNGLNSAADTVDELTARIANLGVTARDSFGQTAKAASDAISNDIVISPQLDLASFKNAVAQGQGDIAAGLGLNLNLQQLDITAQGATLLGAGAEVISGAFKGAQGAGQVLSTVVGQVVNTIIPGLGGVASEIFNVLAAGPEATAGFITGFINAIPLIIENIILSLPALVEALVNGLLELPGRLIESLSNSLPEVIGKLIGQLPLIATRFALAISAQAPFIAIRFAIGFVKDGIPAIVKGFIEELKKGLQSILKIFGGGEGGALKKVTKIFGFADGGMPVFSGGDNILAGFNAKELVVDKTDTRRLSQFLDAQELASRAPRQSVNTSVTVPITLDRAVLATAIFQLNQDGFRTA